MHAFVALAASQGDVHSCNVQRTLVKPVLMQFLAKKNEENRANMEAVMSGPKEDVLTRMLRGLSGAKVTKQGKFMAFDESPFLACNYKNDAGMDCQPCV